MTGNEHAHQHIRSHHGCQECGRGHSTDASPSTGAAYCSWLHPLSVIKADQAGSWAIPAMDITPHNGVYIGDNGIAYDPLLPYESKNGMVEHKNRKPCGQLRQLPEESPIFITRQNCAPLHRGFSNRMVAGTQEMFRYKNTVTIWDIPVAALARPLPLNHDKR